MTARRCATWTSCAKPTPSLPPLAILFLCLGDSLWSSSSHSDGLHLSNLVSAIGAADSGRTPFSTPVVARQPRRVVTGLLGFGQQSTIPRSGMLDFSSIPARICPCRATRSLMRDRGRLGLKRPTIDSHAGPGRFVGPESPFSVRG